MSSFLEIIAFSHPDYTVGSGMQPDLPKWLAGSTAGQELKESSFSPCPKGLYELFLSYGTTKCVKNQAPRRE